MKKKRCASCGSTYIRALRGRLAEAERGLYCADVYRARMLQAQHLAERCAHGSDFNDKGCPVANYFRAAQLAAGKATMDALLKAVGAKWKFKGFRKLRRD